MGCGGSKPDDAGGDSYGGAPQPSGAKSAGKSEKAKKGNKAIEELFRATGQERTLAHDEVLISQGSESDCAYYIKSGKVKLMLKTEQGEIQHLATRGTGDVLGELSLLLGHPATGEHST